MASKATQVTTNEVRISYEHLNQPHASIQGAEPKYSVTMLIPKADSATYQAIQAALAAAEQEGVASRWGGVKPPIVSNPLHDGDGVRPNGEAFGPECKGHWVMTASAKQKPEVVDHNLQPIIQASEVYSGMYARVNFTFFPYFQAGKKGIGCGLGPVQKTRDGEPLAGRVSASEAFGGAASGGYSPNAAGMPWGAPQPVYDPITGRIIGNQ